MNKILLIGCGHMGSALLNAWLKKTNCSFFVIDPIQYKKITSKYNNYSNKVKVFKTIQDIENLNLIDIVIFAIKPQIAKNVLINISKHKDELKKQHTSEKKDFNINSMSDDLRDELR